MFKNWAPWKENRVLRGASKLLVLVFIFSRARDPRSKFFSVLSRGTCVDSCPLCLSLPPSSISESHTLAITLRTCFTGEKTVFLRFSRGKVVRDDEQPPRAVCLEASCYLAKLSSGLRNSFEVRHASAKIFSPRNLLENRSPPRRFFSFSRETVCFI